MSEIRQPAKILVTERLRRTAKVISVAMVSILGRAAPASWAGPTALLLLGSAPLLVPATRAGEATPNPFLDQPAAIEQGEQIYRARCIVCHPRAGGRQRNLFAAKFTDEQFLDVVIGGRRGMPAFRSRLSPDEVRKVLAFVRTHPDGF